MTDTLRRGQSRESEADFQTWVVAYARLHGWQVAHLRDSRRSDAVGLPDLVLARGGVVMLAELKSEAAYNTKTRGLSNTQLVWLDAAGGHVWAPSMRAGIERLLT